ncbi:MAG: hypothetical protein WAW13_04240 [Minisyncoccia bacterium]
MINLIPPEGYKMIKREYLFRVGAVYSFLFSIVFVLIIVALIPMYVLVGAEINDVSLEAEREQGTAHTLQNVDTTIAITNSVLAQLSTPEQPFVISAAIDEIQKLAPVGIVFKTFTVEGVKGVVEKIQVQGTSPTREKLSQLKIALEASELFQTVEVPISDLARDMDLTFTITILPRK